MCCYQIHAVLHQLLQRKAAAAVHRAGAEAATGGVREGGHRMGARRLLQQRGTVHTMRHDAILIRFKKLGLF